MGQDANRAVALQTLRAFGYERKFKRRETMIARGDAGTSVAIIDSGVVRVSLFGSDGRELALALFGPGQLVGEISAIDGKERTADVVAVGNVTATILSGSDFKRLLYSDKDVSEFVCKLLCERIRSTTAYAESQALNSLAGRLTIYFINHGIEQENGSLSLPDLPSQSELARLVGGARESVNRQFRLWRDEGLLIAQGKGYVVPDPVRLQEVAMAE
ncbi:MAG: Crp/Fnr family transcriptional regulator [Paracoccaceae bacterium]